MTDVKLWCDGRTWCHGGNLEFWQLAFSHAFIARRPYISKEVRRGSVHKVQNLFSTSGGASWAPGPVEVPAGEAHRVARGGAHGGGDARGHLRRGLPAARGGGPLAAQGPGAESTGVPSFRSHGVFGAESWGSKRSLTSSNATQTSKTPSKSILKYVKHQRTIQNTIQVRDLFAAASETEYRLAQEIRAQKEEQVPDYGQGLVLSEY